MDYTYKWLNAEKTKMHGQDGNEVICFQAFEGNPPYDEFIESGKTAADYVAPVEPNYTSQEKLDRLLSLVNMTKEELLIVLAAP